MRTTMDDGRATPLARLADGLMPHDELEAWLAVAIGGRPPALREARLLVILAAVIDACGAPAPAALRASCDMFRRLDERAGGADRAALAALYGPALGEILAAIEGAETGQ